MTVPVLNILVGNEVFNYFFSVVFWMGLVAVVPSAIFKLFR